MRLELREFGARAAAQRMAHVSDRLANPRPLFEALSEDLAEIGERRFRTGGDGEWDKLKQASIDRKRRAGLDSRLGHATGRLADSLSQERGRGTSRRISRGVMVWKTTVEHAVWGPKRGNRDWFKLQPRDHKKVGKKIERWLFRGRFR